MANECSNVYSVRLYEDAVVIHGKIPVNDLTALMASEGWRGLEYVDAELAEKFGASLVLTTGVAAKLWRDVLDGEG